MKEKYDSLEIEVITFTREDIITASCNGEFPDPCPTETEGV